MQRQEKAEAGGEDCRFAAGAAKLNKILFSNTQLSLHLHICDAQ